MKKRKKLLDQALIKLRKTKGKKLFSDQESYYYKNICIERKDNIIEMFDTTTDIYRPLMLREIIDFLEMDTTEFTEKLKIHNIIKAFQNNRKMFHIAIFKGKEKEKLLYYNKAKRRLNHLRKLLDINKSLGKFVNY